MNDVVRCGAIRAGCAAIVRVGRCLRRGHLGHQAELIIGAGPGGQLAADGFQPPGQVLQAVTARAGHHPPRYAVVGHPQRDYLVFLVRLDGAVPRRAVPQDVGDGLAEHRRQHGIDLVVKRPAVDRDPGRDTRRGKQGGDRRRLPRQRDVVVATSHQPYIRRGLPC